MISFSDPGKKMGVTVLSSNVSIYDPVELLGTYLSILKRSSGTFTIPSNILFKIIKELLDPKNASYVIFRGFSVEMDGTSLVLENPYHDRFVLDASESVELFKYTVIKS